MHLPRLALLAALALVTACPDKKDDDGKESEKKSDKKKDKKSKDDDDGKKADKADDKPKDDNKPKGKDDESKKPVAKKAAGGHEIVGVTVPAWSKPTPAGKCKLTKT